MAVLGAVAITRRTQPSAEAAPATATRDTAGFEPKPEPPSARNVAVREQAAVPDTPSDAARLEADECVVVRPRIRPRRVQIAVVGGSLLLALAAVAWLYPREEASPGLETDQPVAAVAAAPPPPAPEPVAAPPPAPAVEPEPSDDFETEPLALEPPFPTDEVDTATPHKRRRSSRRRRRTEPEVEQSDPPPADTTPPPSKPTPEPQSAAELLRRANALYAQGDAKFAFRLAQRSYKAAPTQAALTLMALSACRSGNGDAALSALRHLPLRDRAKVRRTCRKQGNPIPLT